MTVRQALTAMLVLAAGARITAATTNELSEAEIEGRDLARQLCELRPGEDLTNASTLLIRPAKGRKRELPLLTVTTLTATNWMAVYEIPPGTNTSDGQRLTVTHAGVELNQYTLSRWQTNEVVGCGGLPERASPMSPFAGSDFWLADLGLEFLHWPSQRILKKELKKGQSCAVLESQNPGPATNGYSRVVSWIDIDTGGIVQADAYDPKGKLLKEFELKEAEKVNGQWQVSELLMRNTQTGSRTTLKFNFGKP